MNCTALKRDISAEECTEYIVSRQEGRELKPCRSCPTGQALMATVRQAVGAFYTPEKETHMEEQTSYNEPLPQTYTQKAISELAGVPRGSSARAFRLLKQGGTPLSPNALKIQAILDTLGLTLADLGIPAPSETPSETPLPEQFEPLVASPTPPAGIKYDTGKLRLDLIPPEAIRALGEVFTFGATKYGDSNWESGIAPNRLYAAVQRHLLSWREGDSTDDESGLSPLSHALCGMAMLVTLDARTHGED